jgi:hypothetical protein
VPANRTPLSVEQRIVAVGKLTRMAFVIADHPQLPGVVLEKEHEGHESEIGAGPALSKTGKRSRSAQAMRCWRCRPAAPQPARLPTERARL